MEIQHPIIEASRQSERLVELQLQFALASDQRAMTFTASIVVLMGFAIASNANDTGLSAGPLLVALLSLSAVFSLASARTGTIEPPAGEFRSFDAYINTEISEELDLQKELLDMHRQIGERNDDIYLRNEYLAKTRSKLFFTSMVISIVAFAVFVIDILGIIDFIDQSRIVTCPGCEQRTWKVLPHF